MERSFAEDARFKPLYILIYIYTDRNIYKYI